MDIDKIIPLLEQKSNEAAYIASLPPLNTEYIPWRRNIEDILETAFGIDSTEYKRVHDRKIPKIKNIRISYKLFIQQIQLEINSIIQKYKVLGLETKPTALSGEPSNAFNTYDGKAGWKAIESEYDVSKMSFGKKINFVSDRHKRAIIFRDVEHSFVLASLGFSKPAVLIAGGVIEELLRLYLKKKNIKPKEDTFNEYIKSCEQHGLLKSAISRLSDSVRQFRNLVHLSAEKTKTYTISKATAKGAVSSIFTISNDF